MRKRFEPQLSLGCTPIEEVVVPPKVRGHLAPLIAALQYIYVTPKWNGEIFGLLESHLLKGKKDTGRKGMSLWEMFVLAQVRLCLNTTYDELHYMSNYDSLLRGVMGVLPTDYSQGKQYGYQNIYDNVSQLDDGLLKAINEVIVRAGHEVFKKKESTALRLKADSFVVETDTHFPTDYNLLWDSARKCLDTIGHLQEQVPLAGWRKIKDWHRALKSLMRAVGQTSSSGGKNKQVRLEKSVAGYLAKARALEKKVSGALAQPLEKMGLQTVKHMASLRYYHGMLAKHIDLVDRRLLKGETIPHQEKVFSIFQDYTELIKKGKLRPNVEIGKKVAIVTDQYDLIIEHQIAGNQQDNQLTRPLVNRIRPRFSIGSYSADRGFWSPDDKEWLESFVPEVCMPKKGRPTKEEKGLESRPSYKKLKNKHSAIESNINELEHRGLDRCPDRNWKNFKKYVALSVTAYNLHKIGRKLLSERLEAERRGEHLSAAA